MTEEILKKANYLKLDIEFKRKIINHLESAKPALFFYIPIEISNEGKYCLEDSAYEKAQAAIVDALKTDIHYLMKEFENL